MFQIPYGNNLLSFNLSDKRIIHFIIFAYCNYVSSFFFFFFSYFFSCHVTFAYDILRNFLRVHGLFPLSFA